MTRSFGEWSFKSGLPIDVASLLWEQMRPAGQGERSDQRETWGMGAPTIAPPERRGE